MTKQRTMLATLLFVIVPAVADQLNAQDLSADEKAAGFETLFNGTDLKGWIYLGQGEGTFSVKEGAIHHKGGNGWLCHTAKEYPDFELRCDFKLIKKGGDGGIFFRATKDAAGSNWPSKRYELQVKDYAEQGRFWGAPYKLDKDKVAKARKPLGEWESYRLVVQGNKGEVFLNGELINTTEGLTRREPAFIGLQAEGGEQAFRNLRIRPLAAK